MCERLHLKRCQVNTRHPNHRRGCISPTQPTSPYSHQRCGAAHACMRHIESSPTTGPVSGSGATVQQNASRQSSRGSILRRGWRGCSGESVWRDARTEQSRSKRIVSCSLKPRFAKPRPRLAFCSDLARPPSGALAATWFARQRLTPKIYAQASRPPLQTARATAKCGRASRLWS